MLGSLANELILRQCTKVFPAPTLAVGCEEILYITSFLNKQLSLPQLISNLPFFTSSLIILEWS